MHALVEIAPALVAMGLLIGFSAFFSASEAALFYLRPADRRALKSGSPAERTASALLADPDRLLSAVLFWNLVINITYFAIASMAGIRLNAAGGVGRSGAIAFTFGSLLFIIFFSEMLPKSMAVIRPRTLSGFVAVPLAVAVRAVDPLMPALRLINLLSRRLLWPRFRSEPYLEVADLERAIELSTTDAALVEQEQTVLRNIVLLSDLRVTELMRPRMKFLAFRPPVSLDDLEGRITPSGYLLVTEPEGDEVAAAIHLKTLFDVPSEHLERLAEPVIYVPWCTTVAETLQQMHTREREVAAVVNEFGETIGILTFEEILDTVLTYSPTRGGKLLHHRSIHPVRPGLWQVSGSTSLRRLARYFDVPLPPTRSVTVAGIVQDVLQRLPVEGDQCEWGPLHFHVISAPERGQMQVQLTPTSTTEQPS